MTRKDYVALAKAINSVRETLVVAHTDDNNLKVALAAVDSVTRRIASTLQDDNPAFNHTKFIVASGASLRA